jgi:hypothetical protein
MKRAITTRKQVSLETKLPFMLKSVLQLYPATNSKTDMYDAAHR